MAIFEQLRMDADNERTLEYALGAFDDAEKAGSRLFLWSAVQHFATGSARADAKRLARLLHERAHSSPYAFAYSSGIYWFVWDDPASWDEPVAAAQSDWEGYEAHKTRIHFRPRSEDLEIAHEFELAHRGDPTFSAYGVHLEESDYQLRRAELETDPVAKAAFLWAACQASASLQPAVRYNLLLEVSRRFEESGRLSDLMRASLVQYQHILSNPKPLHYAIGLYDSGLTGAAALSSDWASFWGESARLELASEIDPFEQEIFEELDRSATSRSKSSDFSRLHDLYMLQNRPVDALETARAEVERMPEEAWCHRNLAWALMRCGQDEEAVVELKQALRLDAEGKGFHEEVHYLSSLAGCQLRLGNLAAAEETLAQAEVLVKQRHWGEDTLQAQRSNLLRAQKRWKDLEDLYRLRISKAKPLPRFRLLLGLGELQYQQHQDSSATFAAANQLADEMGGGAPARLWLAWADQLAPEPRQVLLAKAQSQLLKLAQVVPEKHRQRFLDQPAVAAVMKGEALAKATPGPTLRSLNKQEFLTAVAVLRQRYPQWEQLTPLSVPALLELQARLTQREVALSFTSLPYQVVVMGCDRSGFYLRNAFFERTGLEAQIAGLRQAVSRPRSGYAASARRLYDSLLGPFESVTEGKDVWPASQGQLLNLPWPALQDGQGKFVVEHWASHKLWWGLSQQNPGRSGVEQALLVAAPGQRHLEGVIPEVRAILRTLPGSRSLLGNQASRANLLRWLPKHRWLHLAAHSSFQRSALQNSYVELNDGPLPLSQLYGLKLLPQTTVVLSSCQTAQGQALPGKDLLSIGSGFRVSGAGQVLATLWPVDDEASVEFFAGLYPKLREGTSLGRAVYATSRQFLKNKTRKHPYYWAPYQLEGEMFR